VSLILSLFEVLRPRKANPAGPLKSCFLNVAGWPNVFDPTTNRVKTYKPRGRHIPQGLPRVTSQPGIRQWLLLLTRGFDEFL
jgi:hypothetical protein